MALSGPHSRLGLAAAVVVAVAVAVWGWSAGSGLDPTNPQVTLATVEATVAQKYPLPELTDAQLAGRFSGSAGQGSTGEGSPSEAPSGHGTSDLLFDVREPDEFAQSHLPGARRIDPEMTVDDFQAAYGPELKGRTVVFYCAVGVRSAQMLTRLKPVLKSNGAAAAYNLRGGIFRWHASGRTLVADNTASGARLVHPYNAAWGQLLDRTIKSGAAPQSKAPRAE